VKNNLYKIKGKRLFTRNQLRQKLSLKVIFLYAFFGASFIVVLILLLNFSQTRKANATPVEIKHVQEQVFINDKSVAAPVISVQGKADPNTILIQSIKKAPERPIKK
jgi:hypothetical protein